MFALLFSSLALADLPPGAEVALRRGDCAGVLSATKEAGDLPSALARARCGEIGALAALGETTSVLEPYRRLVMAQALVGEDPAQAIDLLEGLDPGGSASQEVLLLQGRALWYLSRHQEALDALSAVEGAKTIEARW